MDDSTKPARRILKRLMAHPVTRAFHDPVDPSKYPEYFEVVLNPQDLRDIKMRVDSGKYATMTDIDRDVESVWRNAEDYFGRIAPLIVEAARQGRRLFAKLKRTEVSSLKEWCAEVARLRAKEMRLTTSVRLPVSIRREASEMTEFKMFQRNDAIETLTQKELDDFLKAAEMVSDDGVLREMIRIIQETQPQLECKGTEVWLEVTKLRVDTVRELRECMRAALEARGEKYPE